MQRSANVLKRLVDRGLIERVIPREIDESSSAVLPERCSVYFGCDPTADSLHLGHLLPLLTTIHLWRDGHRPIFLVGSATGRFGDPSFKEAARVSLSIESISNNANRINENLRSILSNVVTHFIKEDASSGLEEPLFLDNSSWFDQLPFMDFMKNVGDLSVSRLLSRDSIRDRQGLSYNELTYQLMQAYDWLHLYREYDCVAQVGGTDQMGNMIAGYELIHQNYPKQAAFGLACPLLVASNEQKMSKTSSDVVWLNPERTSPFDLYQYFRRLPHWQEKQYLNLFTLFSDATIEYLMTSCSAEERREQLSKSVTLLIHGDEGLSIAEELTGVLYGTNSEALQTMSSDELCSLFSIKASDLSRSDCPTLLDAVMHLKMFKSPVTAVNVIEQGGVYVNFNRVVLKDEPLYPDHVLPGSGATLIRRGKRHNYLIRWS